MFDIFRTEEYEKEVLLDDAKWVDDFTSQQMDDQNLSQTAKQLVDSVQDPKLANSEVKMGV